MSKALRQFIPVTDNGGQLGFWADTSLTISKGGIVGVQTDEDSFIKVGDKGVGATVGDGATVTTGSPRRLVVQADPMVARIAQRVDTQAVEIAAKAAQTDLDALAATTADFDSAGLARKAEDPGELSIDTGDVAGSLLALRDAYNNLRQAMLNADQIGSR